MLAPRGTQHGFTLIEMSIVLVIIGLIVGGILMGQSLIAAATVRAQVTQIEQFNSAVNTFYGKYGALPGDMPPSLVATFGFTAGAARSGSPGDGDNNGELDGAFGVGPNHVYSWDQQGENVYFWEDLSINSNLIAVNSYAATGPFAQFTCTSNAACSIYYPSAKIGNGAFVYTYSGYAQGCCAGDVDNGPNFFGVSVINQTGQEMLEPTMFQRSRWPKPMPSTRRLTTDCRRPATCWHSISDLGQSMAGLIGPRTARHLARQLATTRLREAPPIQ